MKALARRMGSLVTAKREVSQPANLEEMLAECMDFGRPRIFCADDLTWSCTVKLNTTHSFLRGDVDSGFRHQTPAVAVHAVLEKLRQLGV